MAVDFKASASVGAEYNTNPIELTGAEARLFDPEGKSGLDDTSMVLAVNGSANTDTKGRIQGQVQGQYAHSESSRFDKLGHDDYGVTGNLDWKPNRIFDVSGYTALSRQPLRQADVGGQEATQKTSRTIQGTLRVRPTPRLQLGFTPSWVVFKLPLSDAPDFEYRETSRALSLGYVSPGRLAPGVEWKESSSRYSGIGGATRTQQHGISGTLNYQVTGFSAFTLAAGRTERTTYLIGSTEAASSDSTFTGSLSYRRQLSPKTSITLTAFRDYQQYDLGVNQAKGTGISSGVFWQPTSKFSVSLGSDLAWSTIDDVDIGGGTLVKREDLLRTFSAGVSYRFGRLVSAQARVARRMRNSTLGFDQFNSTIVGLSLTATLD